MANTLQPQTANVTPFDSYTPVGNGVQFTPVTVNTPSSTAKAIEGLNTLVVDTGKVLIQQQEMNIKQKQFETQDLAAKVEAAKKVEKTDGDAYFFNQKVILAEELIKATNSTQVTDARNKFRANLNTYIKDNVKDKEVKNHLLSSTISAYDGANTNYFYWKEKEQKKEIDNEHISLLTNNPIEKVLNDKKETGANGAEIVISAEGKKSFLDSVDNIFNNPSNTKSKNEIVNGLFSDLAKDYLANKMPPNPTLKQLKDFKNDIDIAANKLDPKIKQSNNYNTLIGSIDNVYKESLSHLKEKIQIARSVDNNRNEIDTLVTQLVDINEWDKQTKLDYLKNYDEEQAKKRKSEAAVNFGNAGFNQGTADSQQMKVVNKKIREAITNNDWQFISSIAVSFPDAVSKTMNNEIEVLTNHLLNTKVIGKDGKPISFKDKTVGINSLLHIINKLPANSVTNDNKEILAAAITIANSGANPEQKFQTFIENRNKANPASIKDISHDVLINIDKDIPTLNRAEARNKIITYMSIGMSEKEAYETVKSQYKVDSVKTNHGTIIMKTSDYTTYGLDPSNQMTPYILEGSLNRLQIYYNSANPLYKTTLASFIKNSKNGITIEPSTFPGNVTIKLTGRAESLTIPEKIFRQSLDASKRYEVPKLIQKKKEGYEKFIKWGL